ncbi:MAG: hypothetical protein HYV63_29500 [Candidatus Schekmanbacteria bacterium]|nr:hypothetical protein [Candidatus Schekmanbacteria bacterium]
MDVLAPAGRSETRPRRAGGSGDSALEGSERARSHQRVRSAALQAFFCRRPKDGDPRTNEATDGTPSWFAHYRAAGVIPASVQLDPYTGAGGLYRRENDTVYLGNGAYWNRRLAGDPGCPGYGIDRVHGTVLHELRHQQRWKEMLALPSSAADGDDDRLSDALENELGYLPDKPHSIWDAYFPGRPYPQYPPPIPMDREDKVAIHAEMDARLAERGVDRAEIDPPGTNPYEVPCLERPAREDWANPGKQSEPPISSFVDP